MGIIDEAKHLANGVKREIRDVAKEAEHDVTSVATKAVTKIEHKIEEIPELAEEAIKKALQAAATAISEGVLTKALKIIKVLTPKNLWIKDRPYYSCYR